MAYEDEIETALELIAEFGGDVTYTSAVAGAATTPAQPWRGVGNDDVVRSNVKAAFFPIDRNTQRGATLADRQIIANELVYIAAAALADVRPKPGDQIERAGRSFTVADVDYLNVNGEAILYTLYIEA